MFMTNVHFSINEMTFIFKFASFFFNLIILTLFVLRIVIFRRDERSKKNLSFILKWNFENSSFVIFSSNASSFLNDNKKWKLKSFSSNDDEWNSLLFFDDDATLKTSLFSNVDKWCETLYSKKNIEMWNASSFFDDDEMCASLFFFDENDWKKIFFDALIKFVFDNAMSFKNFKSMSTTFSFETWKKSKKSKSLLMS